MKRFKKLSKKTLQHTLISLYNRIDILKSELAGNNWEESPHHFLFHYTVEEAFAWHLMYQTSSKQFNERMAGNPAGAVVEPKFDEFSSSYHIQKATPRLEICTLINHCFQKLHLTGVLFKKKNIEVGYNLEPSELNYYSFELAENLGLVPEGYFAFPEIIIDKYRFIDLTDLTPIFRYIFEILIELKYDWQYSSLQYIFLIELYKKQQFELQEFGHIRTKLYPGLISPPMEEEIDIKKIFNQAAKELPSDEVVAYFEVYKNWPPGYPPDLEAYMAKLS